MLADGVQRPPHGYLVLKKEAKESNMIIDFLKYVARMRIYQKYGVCVGATCNIGNVKGSAARAWGTCFPYTEPSVTSPEL